MTTNPPAASVEQPKGIDKRLIHEAAGRLQHSASAGFALTALLVYLGQREGVEGRQGLELLQQFIDHSIPSKSLYLVALGFLGLSAAFSRALLAEITRRWIARPLIELSSHALSVAIGTTLALVASAAYVADLRAAAPGLAGAAAISLGVFVVLQFALLVAQGHFDEVLQSHKALELLVCVGGLVVAWTAVQDMKTELERAGEHKTDCVAVQPASQSTGPLH